MGFKDVRARLNEMEPGQEFSFICLPKMAEKIERIINIAMGSIITLEDRPYGVVILVRKQ